MLRYEALHDNDYLFCLYEMWSTRHQLDFLTPNTWDLNVHVVKYSKTEKIVLDQGTISKLRNKRGSTESRSNCFDPTKPNIYMLSTVCINIV